MKLPGCLRIWISSTRVLKRNLHISHPLPLHISHISPLYSTHRRSLQGVAVLHEAREAWVPQLAALVRIAEAARFGNGTTCGVAGTEQRRRRTSLDTCRSCSISHATQMCVHVHKKSNSRRIYSGRRCSANVSIPTLVRGIQSGKSSN